VTSAQRVIDVIMTMPCQSLIKLMRRSVVRIDRHAARPIMTVVDMGLEEMNAISRAG